MSADTVLMSALLHNRAEFFRLLRQLEGDGPELDAGVITAIIDMEYAGRLVCSDDEARAIIAAVMAAE